MNDIKKNKEEPVIKQVHVKILREAIAGICNRYPHPSLVQFITQRLALYAAAVKPYCPHVEHAQDRNGNTICLDCGTKKESTKGQAALEEMKPLIEAITSKPLRNTKNL